MANWIAVAIDEEVTRSSEGEHADRDRGERHPAEAVAELLSARAHVGS
jgi:hypothetical protein